MLYSRDFKLLFTVTLYYCSNQATQSFSEDNTSCSLGVLFQSQKGRICMRNKVCQLWWVPEPVLLGDIVTSRTGTWTRKNKSLQSLTRTRLFYWPTGSLLGMGVRGCLCSFYSGSQNLGFMETSFPQVSFGWTWVGGVCILNPKNRHE